MLKQVLRANAASCAVFGALFLVVGPASARFIGSPPILLLQVLGAGLLLNAILLVLTSLKTQPDRFSVLFFALGDAIWVIATGALLLAGLWITTLLGVLCSVAVAMFVGGCGVLQWRLAPKASSADLQMHET
ncbi:MAG: hypothetical protein ABJL99_16875 [Aliishimia sp.]